MITTIAFLIGRLLYGGYFLMNGVNHFKNLEGMTGYAQSRGTPMPKLAVAVSGALILFGGLGVLLGVYIKWALLAIVTFLVPVTFQMHSFWKDTDQNMKMGNYINFTKNIALLGAALLLLSVPRPWYLALF